MPQAGDKPPPQRNRGKGVGEACGGGRCGLAESAPETGVPQARGTAEFRSPMKSPGIVLAGFGAAPQSLMPQYSTTTGIQAEGL